MWAILSDIHGNLDALETVLQDIEARGIPEERIVCLGDVVGYGPRPAECLERAMRWKLTICGNHEDAVVNGPLGFHGPARAAIAWTREQLEPGWLSGPAARARWSFLANLPRTGRIEDAFLVHGSPRDPTGEYMLPGKFAGLPGMPSPDLADVFSRFARLCFAGHTHIPGVFSADGTFTSPRGIAGRYALAPGAKCLLNAGSVGQPRDGDPRACYVTFDGASVGFHRLEYPVAAAQAKFRRVPELDPRFALRLACGR